MVEVNSLLTEIMKMSKEDLEKVRFQVSVALTEIELEAEDE